MTSLKRFLAVLILTLSVALVVRGDTPTSQPSAAEALRTAAAQVIAERDAAITGRDAAIAERDAARAESDRLPEVWTPQTKLTRGGRYLLPYETEVKTIVVDVPNAHFYGGWVWNKSGSVFSIKGGGTGFRAIGTRFDVPNAPPGGKIAGVGTCVLTEAADTQVLYCKFGSVNECVKAMPGSSDLVVSGCEDLRGDIRSAWVYLAGCRRATIIGCTFLDSLAENGIRTSPHNGVISENVLIAFNVLHNRGTKHAIDARHVNGITIRNNWIQNGLRGRADLPHYPLGTLSPVLRLGDSQAPGCVGAVIEDNDFVGGQLHAHSLSEGVARNNRFHALLPEYDVPLNLDDGKDATGKQVRPPSRLKVVDGNNVAFYTGPAPARFKPLQPGNRWEPKP